MLEDLPESPKDVDSYHIEDNIPDIPYNRILTMEKSGPRHSISLENSISFEPPGLTGGKTKLFQEQRKSMCNNAVPEAEFMTQASAILLPRKSVGIPTGRK